VVGGDVGRGLWGRRVDLQLEVSDGAHEVRAFGADPLKRFDTFDVRGYEIRKIDLDGPRLHAQAQQFRDLRDTETSRQPHDPPISLADDTHPTFHSVLYTGKTCAERRLLFCARTSQLTAARSLK